MKRLFIVLLMFLSLGVGIIIGWNQKLDTQPLIEQSNIRAIDSDILWSLIQNWRLENNLQPYIKDERLCVIARDRVNDGLDNHKGLYQKYSQYPYVIQENSIWQVTSEKDAFNSWLASASHAATLRHPYKYSCLVVSSNSALQIFSDF